MQVGVQSKLPKRILRTQRGPCTEPQVVRRQPGAHANLRLLCVASSGSGVRAPGVDGAGSTAKVPRSSRLLPGLCANTDPLRAVPLQTLCRGPTLPAPPLAHGGGLRLSAPSPPSSSATAPPCLAPPQAAWPRQGSGGEGDRGCAHLSLPCLGVQPTEVLSDAHRFATDQ